jgi:hypothetical protein
MYKLFNEILITDLKEIFERRSVINHAYWASYSISIIFSCFVAVAYWGFVYDPGKYDRFFGRSESALTFQSLHLVRFGYLSKVSNLANLDMTLEN